MDDQPGGGQHGLRGIDGDDAPVLPEDRQNGLCRDPCPRCEINDGGIRRWAGQADHIPAGLLIRRMCACELSIAPGVLGTVPGISRDAHASHLHILTATRVFPGRNRIPAHRSLLPILSLVWTNILDSIILVLWLTTR